MLKENKNILDKWLEFRAKNLARLDSKDKEHLPHIDKYTKNILNNTATENRTYIFNELEKLSEQHLKHMNLLLWLSIII